MRRERTYRFVETSEGSTHPSQDSQRTVRSHAARVSHPGPGARRQPRLRNQIPGEGVIVFDRDAPDRIEERNLQQPPSAASASSELVVRARRSQANSLHQIFNFNTLPGRPERLQTDILSGYTFSPLVHLPTYHKPYIPAIINHYINNLTIPIPELDGISPVPVFRAAWLPVVLHDPVVFQVVVLFAATHYATYADASQYDDLYLELLSLKQAALQALIQTVQTEHATPSATARRSAGSSDTLIAAAAKMASYEAIFGAQEAVSPIVHLFLVEILLT
jgi:hypothetical protein